MQPDTKEKISNIIKESLKNTNFDDQLAENSLSVPLKEAREKFEKEYLTIQLKKFNGNISKTFILWNKSSLKFPISISFFKSLLDKQINLTSTLTSLLPLTLLNFWSLRTLNI